MPKPPKGNGYNLKYSIELYDSETSRVLRLRNGVLGMGDGNVRLIVKYPSDLGFKNFYISTGINATNFNLDLPEDLPGAVSWHLADPLNYELGKEFILGMRVHGFDGLSPLPEELGQRLEKLKSLDTPAILIFKAVIR